MAGGNSIALQLKDLLDEYVEEVETVAHEAQKATAEEAAAKLRDTSPKGATGDYAKGWAVKKTGTLSRVVYNKTDWQLTHLLENGHVIKNQFGTYGRAPAIKHIAPVEEWAADEYPLRVSRGLS